MTATISSRDLQTAQAFLERLLAGYSPRDCSVRLRDEVLIQPEAGQEARYTIVLQHPGALRKMFAPMNQIAAAEAYIYNDIDIEGDIVAYFRFIKHLREHFLSRRNQLSLIRPFLALPKSELERTGRQAIQLKGRKQSLERNRQVIEYHYDDPPTEFFGLFLDPLFQYTCSYFDNANEDLDASQERKVDYVCRKLQLKPGDRLIDFGCGWGGLITFAAQHYGVDAVGVSLSKKQIDVANGIIDELGIGDRCRVAYMDYRQYPEDEQFDKAVSVGFCEHIGEKSFPVFFQKVRRLLKPNGLYLHHAITLKPCFTPFRSSIEFTRKYVFPDGHLATITNTLQQLAAAGLEIRDVESMREHYALTVRNWLTRLEANRDTAIELTDCVTYRIFRLYFAGSIDGFQDGRLNIYQTLTSNSTDSLSGLPLDRATWYARD